MNNDLNELILDVREQVLYLKELGIDSLNVTLSETAIADVVIQSPAAVPNIQIPIAKSEPVTKREPGVSRLASLPSLGQRKPLITDTSIAPPPAIIPTSTTSGSPEQIDAIAAIRKEIGNCVRCPLHAGRTNIAHSTGNFNADLMFVGEAPGADEDEQGVPFVGRAGKLLTQIIEAIGFRRDDVFIGNINRCRPPGNRAPEPAEAEVCKPFLFSEIEVVKPKVIVVLGATAAQNLLQTKVPISKLRGQFHDYLGVKVMPTFHPAYLLRDPHKKREVWEDMKMVRDHLSNN
jgi:uracil-DNA glycosylase